MAYLGWIKNIWLDAGTWCVCVCPCMQPGAGVIWCSSMWASIPPHHIHMLSALSPQRLSDKPLSCTCLFLPAQGGLWHVGTAWSLPMCQRSLLPVPISCWSWHRGFSGSARQTVSLEISPKMQQSGANTWRSWARQLPAFNNVKGQGCLLVCCLGPCCCSVLLQCPTPAFRVRALHTDAVMLT